MVDNITVHKIYRNYAAIAKSLGNVQIVAE